MHRTVRQTKTLWSRSNIKRKYLNSFIKINKFLLKNMIATFKYSIKFLHVINFEKKVSLYAQESKYTRNVEVTYFLGTGNVKSFHQLAYSKRNAHCNSHWPQFAIGDRNCASVLLGPNSYPQKTPSPGRIKIIVISLRCDLGPRLYPILLCTLR